MMCINIEGSYFVRDKDGRNIGVFKPKDEEPFAEHNPKWPKYFQRFLCFCCFGRACLIPKSGFLSEAGASLVDQRFQVRIISSSIHLLPSNSIKLKFLCVYFNCIATFTRLCRFTLLERVTATPCRNCLSACRSSCFNSKGSALHQFI